MDFISEFQNLLRTQPRYHLKQVQAENCGYADTAVKSKSCYYTFGAFYCEDVLYGRYSRKCTDCCGITLCTECELCLECTDCVKCYDCAYCRNCGTSNMCWFCLDCYGCNDCFGCVGLYQKKYHIFNQEHRREEYEAFVRSLDLRDPQMQKEIQQKLQSVDKTAPRLALHQVQSEECVGDNLAQCKGCYQCYDTFASEDCLYNIESNGNTDCVDITVCFEAEKCYSCVQSPLCYNSNFLFHTDLSADSEFCAFSKSLKNCFGCVYLNHKEYHILNQPYSPEEYERKVAAIKQALISQGQYNLGLYFISDYEQQRLQTETDSAIQTAPPTFS